MSGPTTAGGGPAGRSNLAGTRVGGLVRTCGCGEVGPHLEGETVTLFGWVHRRRDHGGLLFLDLRDRTGLVQTVYHPEDVPEAFGAADQVRPEYVVAVRGRVVRRPEGRVNPNLASGTVEVLPDLLRVLSAAKPPPFELDEREDGADEVVRLRHRYLDLRRAAARDPLVLRHRVAKAIRDFGDAHGFVEIETPYLTRSTPEGARDYLVPSRLSPGRFYALPQSPQLFKQLLMVAGFERYLQIVRCFRDEDLRADRQPEFTQVDVECSFVDTDDVLALAEAMVARVYADVFGIELRRPFPRLTYGEALARYGTDKPDLRYGLELVDWTDLARTSGFGVFRQAAEAGGLVKAIRVPAGAGGPAAESVAPPPAAWSRKELDDLGPVVAPFGAKGVFWMAVGGPEAPGGAPEVRSPAARHLSAGEPAALLARTGAGPGDLMLAVAGPAHVALPALGALRVHLAHRLGLVPGPNSPAARDRSADAPCWVVEFPMFTWDAEAARWAAEHHPFTSPLDDDLEYLESDPGRVRAKAYDLVLNGYEAASGSIRIHRRDLQERVFRVMGLPPEEARERFGFLLDAFEYGTPPHGGIALGFDRVCMILAGRASLRDVIAFPKTASAADPLTGAPAQVDPAQLETLHLAIRQPPKAAD